MDTLYITGFYLKRPVNIISMMLGEWFCRATGIDDHDLMTTASAWSAKHKILERKYNTLSNLNDLFDTFNKEMS